MHSRSVSFRLLMEIFFSLGLDYLVFLFYFLHLINEEILYYQMALYIFLLDTSDGHAVAFVATGQCGR